MAGSTRSLGISERTKIHAGHVGWERHPQVGLEIRHSTRHHVIIGNDYFLPGDALVQKPPVPDTLLHARNVCPDIHVEYRLETIAQEPERDVPGPQPLTLKKLDPRSPFPRVRILSDSMFSNRYCQIQKQIR